MNAVTEHQARQPTNHELRISLGIVLLITDPYERQQAMKDLMRIRERRTTWVGAEDLDLRSKIDDFICKIDDFI